MLQKNKNLLNRSRTLQPGRRGDGPIFYWMERDQRIHDNWALLFALQEAEIRGTSVHILFFHDTRLLNHQSGQPPFQLHGLAGLKEEAGKLGIGFSVIAGDAVHFLPRIIHGEQAHLLITDFSPLRSKQQSLNQIKAAIEAPLVEVDAHNIVPAWTVSAKKEYGAYTLRPKMKRLLPEYLTDFPKTTGPSQAPSVLRGDYPDITAKLESMLLETPPPIPPGEQAAGQRMRSFLETNLANYDSKRNDPTCDGQSGLSPYLHLGHLAAQRLAWETNKTEVGEGAKEVFLEELIVRRELSDNFCYYEPNYDSFRAFPAWAQTSLEKHRHDKRHYRYSLDQLENGETHEELWNCCQRDLAVSHKLHGYLRMYWAKKILEWTESPEEALHFAITLNDRYSLDGCDPNGYAGIAWSIGGVHDRAWPEREIFGKIRYMNERGCRRKFDVDRYIATHGGT